jgi:tRNA pseudouridine55 synthase
VLLIDKPSGPTSHDVVLRVRRSLGIRRVGHTGTLDPPASGLLVLLLGRATRLARFTTPHRKRYLGTVRFGWETTTDDLTGEATVRDQRWDGRDGPGLLTRETVETALRRLAERGSQVPPAVSAKKVEGERAYRRARRGESVALREVPVSIYRLAIHGLWDGGADLPIEVECSAGTYVRAIARDLGRELGTRAHLAALRRTAIGPWDVEQAVAPDLALAGDAAARLRPMDELIAHLPRVDLAPEEARRFRHGQALEVAASKGYVVAYGAGELLGVGERRDNLFKPVVGLAG